MERPAPAPDAAIESRNESPETEGGSGGSFLATFHSLLFGESTDVPPRPVPPRTDTAQQAAERAVERWAERQRQGERPADRPSAKQSQILTQRPPPKPPSPIKRSSPPTDKPSSKSRAPRTPPRSKTPTRAQSENWGLFDLVTTTSSNSNPPWSWGGSYGFSWTTSKSKNVGISAKLSDDHEVQAPSQHPDAGADVRGLSRAWGPTPTAAPVLAQSETWGLGLQLLQFVTPASTWERAGAKGVGIYPKLSDELEHRHSQYQRPGPLGSEANISRGARRSVSLGALQLPKEKIGDLEDQAHSQAPEKEAEEARDEGSGGPSLLPVLIILTLLWLAAVAVAVTVEPKGVARVASLLRGEEFDEDATGGFLKPLQFQDRAAQLARNGTIILLVVNSGYLDFFHNWVLHARAVGLEGHFIVVLEDETSFEYVHERWPGQAVRVHVPELERADSEALRHEQLQNLSRPSSGTGAASQMDAPAFRMMMYRRLFYIRLLLAAKLDVLLCDVDIIFLKDPMPYFSGTFDMYGVMEIQDGVHWYDNETVPLERGSSMYLNAGFLYFRPHLRTFLLLDFWLYKIFRAERKTGIENDQVYLRFVIINLSFLNNAPRVAVVPQQLFPPGWLYFGHSGWGKNHSAEVVTVHNNWIRTKECKMLRWLHHGLWQLPGTNGAIPNITVLDNSDSDDGRVLGLRGVNWTFEGVPGASLPWNASECRVGTGMVHPNELKQWN